MWLKANKEPHEELVFEAVATEAKGIMEQSQERWQHCGPVCLHVKLEAEEAFDWLGYSRACHNNPNKYFTVDLCGLCEGTVIRWFSYFRDICSNHLVNHPYTIGGPGQIVELDESLIAKRKNNVGCVLEQRWVFGGVCPATGQGFLTHIPDKTAATMLPLIIRHIEHTDGLLSYNNRHATGEPTIPASCGGA
ncbi:hypothetical protein PoB_003938100 [Plakobranchus ocellatus]|uniref:ISXO2-like transposase domain-containing protein n=1 Tax=Plakobranchus ocellatus TaxID=259542 RepID=A0AAV4AXB8_9GAST|nr:hypothetical protein PoB_003938100 [Plakobranchus ocellatus]